MNRTGQIAIEPLPTTRAGHVDAQGFIGLGGLHALIVPAGVAATLALVMAIPIVCAGSPAAKV